MIHELITNILADSTTIDSNLTYGLIVLGAGLGIGLIGAKASEVTGRNPGARMPVLVIAIVLAALIEGIALIALFR